METQGIRVVRPGDRAVPNAGQTPGMTREEAFSGEGRWAGFVRLEPSVPSGWHHHGDNDSYIYMVTGGLRFESGPGGSVTSNAGEGDFVHIAPRVVHRETSGPDGGEAVVIRAGSGPPLVNVDGPE